MQPQHIILHILEEKFPHLVPRPHAHPNEAIRAGRRPFVEIAWLGQAPELASVGVLGLERYGVVGAAAGAEVQV